MDTPTLIGTGFFALSVFVWFFCALLAYQTAEKRGRRPVTWGVLGVIFGPFALFAVYVLPRGHLETHHEKQHPTTKANQQAALYEVPKKKH